ncbi:hypothetical protein BCR44DRAFT_1252077 [Catenaria anguillulae PL171]|uniref:Uncharacterized protein n=1 Tax=Catenaria anguillulae PL171 TaxID=765915 RepID=A0A1Y2HYG3_9FUNG|nr:hypothetical protein BCR44DRAFT_1252077 [Catenaria anguillulae PL171]
MKLCTLKHGDLAPQHLVVFINGLHARGCNHAGRQLVQDICIARVHKSRIRQVEGARHGKRLRDTWRQVDPHGKLLLRAFERCPRHARGAATGSGCRHGVGHGCRGHNANVTDTSRIAPGWCRGHVGRASSHGRGRRHPARVGGSVGKAFGGGGGSRGGALSLANVFGQGRVGEPAAWADGRGAGHGRLMVDVAAMIRGTRQECGRGRGRLGDGDGGPG